MSIESDQCSGGLAPRRGSVKARLGQLSYLQWGSAGQPLLLLHGITSSARTWWRVAPQLAERGYQVYAFDMPGHGESDATDAHAIPDVAALIAQAANTIGLDQPALIGHSWGGAAALALASMIKPAWMVLVDPLLALTKTFGASRVDFYLAGVGSPREEILPVIRANNPDWHDCDVFWKAEAMEQCRAAAVQGLFLKSGDWALLDRIAAYDAPLLLITADPQHTIIAPPVLAAARSQLRAGLGEQIAILGTTHNVFRGSGFEPFMRTLLGWLDG